MGVKSTVFLTREAAEQRFVDLFERIARRDLISQARTASNEALERAIEHLNDEDKGGEGFENYVIGEDHDCAR